MRRFEHRHVVGHVGARCNADAAHLGRDRVGEKIPVEVHRGQHIEFLGAQQHHLEHDVGDAVLDDNPAVRNLALVLAIELFFGNRDFVEFLARNLVSPAAERTFGELHDVALVHQGHRFASVVDRVLDGLAHQALGTEFRNRLDAQTRVIEELGVQLFAQEFGELEVFGRAGLVFDTGIDVFGVLAKDHHVNFAGGLQRTGHPGIVADRAHAGIQVQILTQRDVERAEAAADRRGQRPLDRNDEVAERLQRFGGTVVAIVEPGRLFAEKHFTPVDPAFAAVRFFDRRIPDPQTGPGDVRTDTVTFDVANDRLARHQQLAIFDANFFAGFRVSNVSSHLRLSPCGIRDRPSVMRRWLLYTQPLAEPDIHVCRPTTDPDLNPPFAADR